MIFPQTLPTLARYAPRRESADLVQWFWVPRWDFPAGQVHRQELLPFPAANLTVEPAGITVTGPSTAPTHRDLRGKGWALGVLLQPAGLAALGISARSILDSERAYPLAGVHAQVTRAMAAGHDAAAVAHVSDWLEQLPPPAPRALEANRLLRIVAQHAEITSTSALARAMHASPRTIQRLAEDHLGLTPREIIRRYRIQESAKQLREGAATVAEIAARLGYTDQAHLTHDFRRTLGYTPRRYRRSSR